MPRTATIRRETAETDDRPVARTSTAPARHDVATGVGFFDHMLTHLAKHGLFDLTVKCQGDLHVDAHHTVEDVGICFGKALAQALGDKAGIRRYGDATVPMDETLVTAAVDLSGRPFWSGRRTCRTRCSARSSSQLAEEFWRAVSSAGAFNLHVVLHHGRNTHHIVEAIFKATARALRQAPSPTRAAAGCRRRRGCCRTGWETGSGNLSYFARRTDLITTASTGTSLSLTFHAGLHRGDLVHHVHPRGHLAEHRVARSYLPTDFHPESRCPSG